MDIAIVGRGAVLPGGKDIAGFWQSVLAGESLARSRPADDWPVATSRDNLDQPPHRQGFYCDPVTHESLAVTIDAEEFAGLDPSVQMTLKMVGDALAEAGEGGEGLTARTGLILGHIALPTASSATAVDALVGGTDDAATKGPRRFWTSEPARYAARKFGLGGKCYTLDAACASSLYALDHACKLLADHRADVMVAGGLNAASSLYTQIGFNNLSALSATEQSRPFDSRGDGLLVGEGGAAFVLKRLSDAKAAGQKILGVIRGIGLSNDRSGKLLAPCEC